jgi:hypothetical protein
MTSEKDELIAKFKKQYQAVLQLPMSEAARRASTQQPGQPYAYEQLLYVDREYGLSADGRDAVTAAIDGLINVAAARWRLTKIVHGMVMTNWEYDEEGDRYKVSVQSLLTNITLH